MLGDATLTCIKVAADANLSGSAGASSLGTSVVGYGIGKRIDTRLTLAALRAAIESRRLLAAFITAPAARTFPARSAEICKREAALPKPSTTTERPSNSRGLLPLFSFQEGAHGGLKLIGFSATTRCPNE